MMSKGVLDRVYVVFMDLEKAYERVDREALWKVLRMCTVASKP